MLIVADAGSTSCSPAPRSHRPDDGIVAVGSGGPLAMAAARALARHSALGAREIAEQSMAIAGELCIYTNTNLTLEEL